jgi:LEA14-like dessication related protein
MTLPDFRLLARWLLLAGLVLGALSLSGCASLMHREPVRINVVGLEPLPGQGMEMRFAVKLRVQNPNDSAIDFDGPALDLDLNDKPFATGVSDQRGSVPRFGETLLEIPVTVSAVAVVRQALGVFNEHASDTVPYVLRGRLAGGVLGGVRFTDRGTLSLPAALKATR